MDMAAALPLSRYTVLDLTIARAGPTAVRLLADWGANVIKIEPPPAQDGSLKSSPMHWGFPSKNSENFPFQQKK